MSDYGIEIDGLDHNLRKFAYLQAFLRNGDPVIMKKVGIYAKNLIVSRTKSGVDVHNAMFNRKKDGSRSNLVKSGAMLKGLKVESTGKFARIYMTKKKRAKAKITHHGLMLVHDQAMRSGSGEGFKMPQREFMGFQKSETAKIGIYFRKLVEEKVFSII